MVYTVALKAAALGHAGSSPVVVVKFYPSMLLNIDGQCGGMVYTSVSKTVLLGVAGSSPVIAFILNINNKIHI